MKKRLLLLGLISLIMAFSANGQIVTKYQQGFESTGETSSYTIVQGSASVVTSLSSSGDRALKLQHSSQEVIVMLDTIDFTDNGQFQFFYLEFMHICDVDPFTAAAVNDVAKVEVRRVGSPDWVPLNGTDYYDITWGGGSTDYISNSSFSKRSYSTWMGPSTNNTWWKRERFKLQLQLQSIPLSDRKLLIRFRLRPRTSAGASNQGWYLDNIKVQCSPNSMLLPVMTMVDYPDLVNYPNSRGTHLATEVTTPLTQGICNDSVYVEYQLGTNTPILRKTLTPMTGSSNRWETYLPFCGYDTIVKWHIVAKDNTINHNQTNFPSDASAWMTYKSIRGRELYAPMSDIVTSGNLNLPFPNMGDMKCEIVYDSAEMTNVFGPGAITQIRFPVANGVVNSTRNRFVVKMSNVPTDFAFSSTNDFYTGFQKQVYDSSLVITQNANTYGTINLQDTFFYAGKGLRITMISDNVSSDPSAVSVRTFNAATGSNSTGSLHVAYNASYGMDPFTSPYFQSQPDPPYRERPNFSLRVNKNVPLLYDCGISGYVTPNDSTSANAVGTNNVVVTLKNFGALPINSVRIYFSVDNGAHQYYDWTGNLAGGATTDVTISTTQTYPAGYHEMLAWVDDSVLSAGSLYRDHEPLNDTLWTRFISCDGPMSGIRTVGGSTPDYQSLEKLLYALSQCGVNGPLTVKLANGFYMPHTFPTIPGASASNYVQFEPLSGNANTVVFVSSMHDTAMVNSLVNLQRAHHIRFKKISFQSSSSTNRATYLVRMGTSSTGCQFDECTFSETPDGNMAASFMAASALLYSGGADSMVVRNCSFNRGTAGISLVGPAQDNMAHGSTVHGCSFQNQGVNGIIVRNQVNAVIDSNTCNGIYANSSYAILLQDCDGATKVTRNTVYVTSGASCIGATNFFGSPAGYAVVANNMLVCADDGTSNMLTTPLNIITANYSKILYNSIRMTAPTRSGIAAATFGGGTLENSYFYNNIVACFDTVNFAFNYIPTENATNYIGYNIYYSQSPLLNKYDGINCYTFANWQSHCSMDGNSQNVNPAFLVSTPTDLRSYSQNVKEHGVPFVEVTDDMFGTTRNATAPCVGAFEFSALPYDFEILEFLEPYDEYCEAPSAAPLRVVIKNSGINAYDPSTATTTVQLTYSRTNTPGTMAPGVSGNIVINRVIPPTDTIILNTSATIPFPANGLEDTTYKFYAWLTSTIDPNPANDTSMMTVTAHYHAPAPNNVSVNSNYGDSATVTVSGGLQTWYSNVYTNSTSHQSEVYWYTSATSDSAIWRGNTFTTGNLYTDTTLYVRQKRDFPLVKITEVQLKQNAPGVTYPMPLWMNASTTLAVELTNIGDYPANLLNDTIMLVSNTSSLNNKIYKFPNVTIQPGKTLVLQYRAGINNVDSTKTIATATVNPNQTANLGIIYRSKGIIRDAVALNEVTTQTNWTNKNVPSTVWYGPGISLPDSIPTAGVYRTAWPAPNASYSNTASRWQRSDDNNKMTMGTTNSNLVRFHDNGCLGDVATVSIHLINLPNVDMVVENLDLTDGCGMGVTPITVDVHNRGAQPSGQVVLNYRVTGYPQYTGQAIALQTCSDTLVTGLSANSSIQHTFSIAPDFTVASASVDFDVLVWVEKVSADNTTFNDTIRQSLTSLYMPGVPNVQAYDTVMYDSYAVLHSITAPTDSLKWYDRFMNVLDTCNVYTTSNLYVDDTFYVSGLGARINPLHVGNMATLTTASAYPSPYNPKKKYVKEQYLYLASELIDAGHSAGPIQTVAFYLDTILAPSGTMSFTNYTISIGTTSQTTFTANNGWLPVTNYYSVGTLTLSNTSKGWITHNLTNAFHWNGTDNIVVQITRTINPAISQGARTRYTNGGANKVIFKNDDNTDLVNFTASGSRSANRPDVRFGFVDFGCEGPTTPVYITVIGTPDADASISWTAADTSAVNSCDSTNININLRNMGVQPISGYTVDYWIDNSHGVYSSGPNIAPQTDVDLTIVKHLFTPGRHVLRMAVTLAGDTVQSNDTISKMINVRFCAGNYTIGSTGLYTSFNAAIDTLVNAGVDGAVVFNVQNGVYNEQVTLGSIDGVSATNTVTFVGNTQSPSSVVLRYAPVNAANYVINIDGAHFIGFEGITFLGRGTGNYSNVITISNSSQINFKNDVIRVKGGLNNTNASCLLVGDGVHALRIESSVLDSGYYSVKSIVTAAGLSDGVYIVGDTIRNYMVTGVHLRKIDDIYIYNNHIATGANTNRALTGVFVAEHNGPVTVERNNIVLGDNYSGAKVGVKLVNVVGANATRSLVSNNMCAISGKNSNSSAGIWIDSSTWINVFYNSCRLEYPMATNTGQSSAAMHVGSSSEISLMNNIFSHDGSGFALFVQQAANIANSNYNDYYTRRAENAIALWGGEECLGLDGLRQINHMDNNSLNLKPYFVSGADLHLTIGNLCEKAQYNTMVPLDLDGYIRPQIPNPCIGAHEFVRKNHNVAIVEIYEPTLETDNIESDTLWIRVKLINDGTSTESNLRWWAYLSSDPQLTTTQHIVDELLPQDTVVDVNYIVMPIGVIDTQTLVVMFPMSNDSVPENNILESVFFLDPAYNFRAKQVIIHDESGCRLQNTPVSVMLTNVGRKTFLTGTPVPVGFQAVLNTAGITVSTLPTTFTETINLPVDVEPNADVTLDFVQTANLYPTGNDKDITVRARAWSTFPYDQKPLNDTTTYVTHSSYYTPKSPIGVDLHIPYATWDTIHASQTDTPPTGSVIHRPILWFRDSTDAPYFTSTNYQRSTWWETPQYFHDSTYYLCCVSTHGNNVQSACTSYFSAVHVNLNARVPVDMAVLDVVEPVGTRVYMTNDSVKVALINYGTQAMTNIPVVYELYNSNNVLLQHVEENCTATIQPDSVYVFRFDSLLSIPSWSATQSYRLRTWTDLPNENVRLNDTLRDLIHFYAAPDNVYPVCQIDNKQGLDITRVSFSSLDNQVCAAGQNYINFVNSSLQIGAINNPQTLAEPLPDYGGNTFNQQLGELRALHLIKGTVDTMTVEVMSSDKSFDNTTSGWLSIWIDADRDGSFRYAPYTVYTSPDDSVLFDSYPATEVIYQDTIISGTPKKFVFTLPSDIRTGYMRMRVVVDQGATKVKDPTTSFQFGQMQDYLLYIEDRPTDVDLAASRIVSPREQHIGGHTGYTSDSSVVVTFMMSNKGAETIHAATIDYLFSNVNAAPDQGVLQWTGDLDAGQSVAVDLPARVFAVGLTNVEIVVNTLGDTNNLNDTLLYQYYRAPVKTLVYSDDFEDRNEWFIPRGYSPFTQNLWQRGVTNKPNIMACVSDSCVMGTNLNGFVNVYTTGNVSYAYTPIINISIIRPDTLDLWVARDMAEGHLARIEFYDYMGRWSVVGTANDSMWYNNGTAWDSISPGYGYSKCRFPLSKISGDFQQRLQFRMVYKVEPESNPCDGVVIDNFKIGRQRRNLDVGVIAITYPTAPKFGQIINPKVIIKNYGLDTLYSIQVAYLPYGVNLARTGTYTSTTGLKPGESDIYEFETPFVVKNDFPDTFQICSYTIMNMDMYADNDSVCGEFYLSPLDNDVSMVSFMSPLQRTIAGDSIVVTTRIRNYGQAPVSSANVTYIYNGTYTVTETVDFNALLGHDLQSFEYINYSFRHKFRASMGIMDLMAYIKMEGDDYPFNDTIAMKVEGLSAITDIRARAVVVDTSTFNMAKIQVIVDNVGARAVNDFKIGYYYYNDTSTLVDTVWHGTTPLPALSSLYYEFPEGHVWHPEYFKYVTAFVTADEDNDRTNDTTSTIVEQYVDYCAIKVLVEENRYDSCNVRLEFENMGNVVTNGNQEFKLVGVINGCNIKAKNIFQSFAPGVRYYVDFPTKIPKSPTRTYTGSVTIDKSDYDNSNNQTTNIEVVNYLNIPYANASSGMALQQNYPNPFDNSTRIEFFLPTAGDVRFFVMDELGRLVHQRVESFGSGDHSINFNSGDLSTGVYYYGIEKDGERLMRRMVIKR